MRPVALQRWAHFAFMADDLSLLFRLRAENTQAKAVMADTRAAVNQLRQSFGPQLTQTVSVANKTFSDLGNNLNVFVGQRLPLVGGAFIRITENLRNFGKEGANTEKAIAGVAKSIQSIATQSGKSIPQIASFLGQFVRLEGQAKRDSSAIEFFGASLGAKLIPQLEEAGTAMAGVAEESAGAGGAIAAMAGPIGIAVLVLAALAAGAAIAAKQLFDLAKSSAEFEGRMFDLAQQTGLAVETLSALEVVAKTTGGNLDSIAQATVLFQRKLDDAQDPLSKTAEQFRKFNIATIDTETSLRQTFLALAAMPAGFAQTNAAAEFFGARGGKQVLAILKETNGDIDGTIKQLRELGILITEDQARAADKFNDELALLNFQFRALGAAAVEDVIPALVDIIRAFGDLVHAARPLISLFGTTAGFATRQVAESFKGLSIVVQALTRDYEGLARSIKEAQEAQNIAPLQVPSNFLAPTPLPGQQSPQQAASEAISQADEILAAVKRNAAQTNQALSELFQKGRRDRQQETEGIIAENKKVAEAEQNRIDKLIEQKQLEIRSLDEASRNRGESVNRDTEQYRAAAAVLTKLFQERLDKENEFDVTSKALRAKAAKERADAIRNQVANERDILVGEFDRIIKDIEAQVKRGSQAEEIGLVIIQQLEQAKIDARLASLQQQKDVGFLTVQDQRDLDAELKKLQQEKNQLEDDQRARRLQRERDTAERTREIAIAGIDTLLQLEQSAGQRRIDTLQALAERRVITEEDAAREILRIRLRLIDDEIEATKAKLKAAGSITGKDERVRTQADLNNQIKVLKDQRLTIEAAGNRDIDDKRREDIDNERRYAKDLLDIKERISDIERNAAEEVIRLMVLHFARRRDIVRARLQLDIDDENARHRQAQETIRELELENREANKTAEERLEAEREINQLRETEAERHRLVLQDIKEQGRKDEREAEPLGRLGFDTDSLREFASVLESTVIPLGEILRNTFSQVADAIGQTVANWVLLGETGPAVMRKILAQALASIAAEAAVNAIKELALGFATLFFNPAESAAHFTAAGLWGSIAGVAAIAGRGVAGDLFKTPGASGGGTGSSRGTGELNPLSLARNAGAGSPRQVAPQVQPIHVTVAVVPDGSRFSKAVTAHIVEDVNNAGPIREVLAGDGNLSRG